MRWRDRLTVGCGLAALVAAIFGVGGAPRIVQAAVAVLVALAVASQLWSHRASSSVSPVVAVLAVAIGLTALQLIPLGDGIVSQLNPTGAALRADGAAIAQLSLSPTLTFDAPGSLSALAFFVILLGVVVVAGRFASSERGRYYLLASVAAACALVAVVCGIHALLGAHSLYGFYEPKHAAPRVLGPLLNGNHLGCLMALGAVVAAGLVMYRRQPAWRRVGWLLVIAACGVVAGATYSRGAALALGAGAVVVAATLLGQRIVDAEAAQGRRAGLVSGSLPIAVVAGCAVVVVLYASAGGVTDQLQRTTVREFDEPRSKFAAWRSATTLIDESPWIGWGRGAFEPAFTRVNPSSGLSTFSHAENEYVQAVVDWGIGGAALLAIAAGWMAVVALRRWRDGPLAAGAIGGLTVVLLQSNVDFGVELLGLALPVTLVATTLCYTPLREVAKRPLAYARLLRAGLVVALAASAAVLVSDATISVAEDHERMTDPSALTLEELRGPMERHPLDYRNYELAAEVLWRAGDPAATHVLNHALTLHPTHAGLHILAANMLFTTGHRDQGAVELAAALRASNDPRKLLAEIVTRLSDPELAASAIPADDRRFDAILRTLDELKRSDVAAAWLVRVLALRPDDLRACDALFGLALRHHDLSAIDAAGHSCPHYHATRPVRISLAKLLLANNEPSAAIEQLADVEGWTGLIDEKIEGWLLRCDAYSALNRWDDAERCLHRLEAVGYLDAKGKIDIVHRLDRLHQARDERDKVQ